jgi:hypothetical protein
MYHLTYNQSFNNQLIGYVNISDYIGSATAFNAVFVYTDETVTHSFSIKQECRFTVINCVFKTSTDFGKRYHLINYLKKV